MSLPGFARSSQRQILITLLFCAVFFAASSSIKAIADDPLNALPTAEDTVDDKVKRLTKDELDNIRIPEDGDRIIFSVEVEKASEDDSKGARKLSPWLQVYADGRIVCDSSAAFSSPGVVRGAEGSLSSSELTWLLHIVVNECGLLKFSTNELEDRLQAIKSKPSSVKGKRYQYGIMLDSGENNLAIPEEILVVRPLRRKMGMGALASLHKYLNFLVSRANLGDPENRQSLLEQLNSKLSAELPKIPAFRMEHLNGAIHFNKGSIFGEGLSAVFQQEIEEQKNHFRQVTGFITRKEGAEPEFKISTMEYQKLRP